MGFWASLGIGALGFFLSIAYFSTVLLPIIYGFPKSLYLSLRGEMRWMAPLHYLLVALGWLIGWSVIFFVIFKFFPEFQKYSIDNDAFHFGSIIGTVGIFHFIAMARSASDSLNEDFSAFTGRYVIRLVDDPRKYACLKACYDGMRNLFFFSIGGFIATIIAANFNNNFVYACYLIATYIILTIFILDVLFKIFATLSSIMLFGAKVYYWCVGNMSKSREFISFADLLATVVALALNGLPILVVYLSMSVVTPNHWNIFTFIGL